MLALVVVLVAPPAWADHEAGKKAFKRGDLATGFEEWRALNEQAEQGEARAQYKLGVMYDWGYGVTKDYGQAARWYRRAAEQGDADAQYNLGLMYYHGEGVPQADTEAARS